MLAPDLLTQVRLYADQIDGQARSLDELLGEVLVPQASKQSGPVRRGWLVAVATAVLVFVAAGLAALVFGLPEGEPVVDEPEPPPVETLNGFDVEDVPSFFATVEYHLADPSVVSGMVEISYRRGDDGLRMEYIAESVAWLDMDSDPPIDGPSYQPGDFLVWDNSQVAFDNAVEGQYVYQTDRSFTGLGQLGWVTGWTETCAPNTIEALPEAVVAGIPALHVRCNTINGDVELWVDKETGVILAVTGVVTVGPRGAPEGVTTELSGGYTITGIEYLAEPAFDPGLFEVEDGFGFGEDEFGESTELVTIPGMHVVVRRMTAAELIAAETVSDITEDSTRTVETWYVDDTTWRENVLDAGGTPLGGPWSPNSYTVVANDQQLTYFADGHAFVLEEDQGLTPFSVEELGSRQSVLDNPDCSYVADTTYLGRTVDEYVCGGANLDPMEQAAAQRLGIPEEYVYLIDTESGLVLYEQGPAFLREVLSIDFDSTFEQDIFSTEPPAGASNLYTEPRPSNMLGQSAPALAGTLLDGSTFDSTTVNGKRTVLFFWASWCESCVDALEALQAESERADDDIVFVTVLTFDDPEAGQNAINFYGVNLPVIDDSQGLLFDTWQAFDWPWLILIDANGTVVEVRGGGLSDHIANNLNHILNNAPW